MNRLHELLYSNDSYYREMIDNGWLDDAQAYLEYVSNILPVGI